MKRYNFSKILLAVLATATLISCNKSNRTRSELTGWKFNDPTYGGFTANTNYQGQKVPPGMVLIEGGTFTMGSVQDDVMFDWNTTPTRQQVRSFFMDEAEVTNLEYLFYLQYLERVFPPSDDNYRKVYQAALPDTLVWRDALGFNELLTETYLRHPSYADYPVVGVSWLQATEYCKWRTDRVNEKILMERGVLKSLFEMDSVTVEGKNRFDTQTYLANPDLLFDGNEDIYGKGLPDYSNTKKKKNKGNSDVDDAVADTDDDGDDNKKKRRRRKSRKSDDGFVGRHVKTSDGILTQRFRLPTEAEWEYAAKALIENREYNTIRGRKKYSWNGRYTRDQSKGRAGDQLANFKQGKGDYSGLAGWSNDGADITIKIKSYDPNAFGLYDMSGNVAEWVADVYRPIVDNDANDFNYFRGNVFKKPLIDEEGKVVVVDYSTIEFDTLDNGKIVPKDLPGSVKYVPITKRDAFMRPNYEKADNRDLNDGDLGSTKYYYQDDEDMESQPRMYNSPQTPKQIGESGLIIQQYDTKKRNTLISNQSRVYKGGSWRDREYWLDPSQRRYLPEYMATNYIGFRCATDKLGDMTYKRRRKEPTRK
ncbi:MAG: gliding motility lipoprotein GldJ [Flavobacteriales bacterium]|nr:MAG: gliding motility lipoprotein GldJ [Flavobacteriales bacterium]PIE48638.1 MAG: gliding motility lipoprotein GldJ [Flavobacteriales bacterium]